MVPYNGARTKVQLKLTIQRCKMLQEKKEAMAKQARRDISALVEKGKLETARIKTEGIISEDIHLELLELMELYAETLLARFALLDMPTREPDLSIMHALTAIIHAAPRTELKELHVLREMLMAKFGREFAQDVMDNKDSCVPERVMAKLLVEAPEPKLVDLYIFEICKAYDVPFSSPHLPETKVEEEEQEEAEVEEEVTTNAKDTEKSDAKLKSEKDANADGAKKPDGAPPRKRTEKEEVDSLEARFAALKRR
ncbi:related to IST1 - protein with a positive role in the multivesicular body sorting pathway [Ustilago trichophora]|uniref:Related to IST1 - protein with a positive role in the multivesicular body sorting pathway n=1 Tax=Ustilago trichophora TaxID=86804 RepID=A0A5C3E8E1_9BASI|nr:related to IST1 - protein with a positive role in the multivesicular body sorting pathway [Ustilago trichophora]